MTDDVERGRLLLAWQVHPLARRPVQAVLAVGALLTLLPLLYLVLGHLLGALLLWGAVVLSLAPAFLPATYELYAGGVCARHGLRGVFRPWTWFLRYDVDEAGVFLSPFATPRRLEAFRGIYLRAADNKETILEIVRAHLDVEIPGEMWYTQYMEKVAQSGSMTRVSRRSQTAEEHRFPSADTRAITTRGTGNGSAEHGTPG